jgi:peptidoglycan hydrolase FlgJ
MIPVNPASPGLPLSAHKAAPRPAAELTSEQAQLRKAAEGFEAFLVRKMLETARAAFAPEATPLTGGGMQQFTAMRDERLAEIAAQTGAFGFARSIEAQLAQYVRPHDALPQGDA